MEVYWARITVSTYEEIVSSKIIFMISHKIFQMREKDFSVWPFDGGVGVFCLRPERELISPPISVEDLTGPLI